MSRSDVRSRADGKLQRFILGCIARPRALDARVTELGARTPVGSLAASAAADGVHAGCRVETAGL